MDIRDVQKRLKDELDSLDVYLIVSNKEYCEMFPDQAEDWDPGDYLVVMDKHEDKMVLGGAYSVEAEEEGFEAFPETQFFACWLPYPEEPYRDIEVFINMLKKEAVEYMKNRDV